MKYNQTMACLLLTAMLAASAVSCSGVTDDSIETSAVMESESTVTETSIEALDALDARMLVDDGLETVDYGGATFRILGVDYNQDSYVIEKENGDVMDDAVFRRNSAIMERFNIVIEADVTGWNDQTTKLKTSVMAGDDAYQLYSGHVVHAGSAVNDSIFSNWYDMPNIDFSKPWYAKSNIEDLTYDGKAFLCIGDFALSAIGGTYCIYYNKQIAADYDLPDFYEIVNSGTWTIDRMTEISREVYRDLNGNGESDAEDLHGLAMFARSPVNTFLWAFGEKIAKQQEDGTIVLDYFNNKVVDIYQKLHDLLWVGNTTFTMGKTDEELVTISNKFLEGKALFFPSGFSFAASTLRNFEPDYGILPYPKWDTAQENYYTMVDGSHDVLAVPISVSDPAFVGTITEALNAESYKRTVPVYYDIVLKTKGSRDEESVAMLDRIFENRVFDFGYVYGGSGAAFWVQELMLRKSADISSHYEKKHKSFDKSMNKVFAFFEEYEAD